MYYAVRLTFGCHSSPKLFDTLSEALCWILSNNCKLPFVPHVLDNFLLIDYPHAKPNHSITMLKDINQEFPYQREKTSGPLQVIEFLGNTLDSNLVHLKMKLQQRGHERAVFKCHLKKRFAPSARYSVFRLLNL